MKLITPFCFSFLITILLVNVAMGQTPTITSFAPTSGAVGTLVTITGTNLGNPTTFTIGVKSAIVVSSSATQLVGIVMPHAATGNILVANSSGSINSSNNFTVTATNYPSVQQGNKLVGTGSIGAALQAYSVAISADGNTAVIGGCGDNNNQGAAWIFIRSGASWSQQGGKLIGSNSIGTSVYQGSSVAISADGNTVIVGGNKDDNNNGAAWIFTRNGNIWTQQGNKLIGTGVSGPYPAFQGSSVSISADGNTAIVGGFYDNGGQGATWVYSRNNGIWTQQGNKLVGSGSIGLPQQGSAVAISADGGTIVIGGSVDDNYQGAIWIFTKSNNIWTQQGNKIVGTGFNLSYISFGVAVGISSDGNTVMVAGNNNNQGAAWLFNRNANIWTQQFNKLLGAGGGVSVALSGDGNTAIMGGTADDNSQGAIYILVRNVNG